ncbi:MAG TPA: DUF433 domain-containing protein [candidate division Zixibacteria bacterium]|nr:DUF433 domain-containing protein [candidate division Zixibacteria bacterium]
MTTDWKAQIASKVSICHGKVCIKNTRVMLSVILNCVAEGMSEDAILKEYPSLKKGDVSIALQYAASLARGETIPLKAES